MALPQEVDAEKVRVVKEAIAKMSSQEIVGLPSIDKDDFRLFGAITQLYCFLDLNLRAALEVMHRANRLPPESVSKYPDYRDAALSAILKGSAVRMDPKVEKLEPKKAEPAQATEAPKRRAVASARLPSVIVVLVVATVATLSLWYLVRPEPLLVQGEADATSRRGSNCQGATVEHGAGAGYP
jgi:hypothetical protein